jgi:hypothetical protein
MRSTDSWFPTPLIEHHKSVWIGVGVTLAQFCYLQEARAKRWMRLLAGTGHDIVKNIAIVDRQGKCILPGSITVGVHLGWGPDSPYLSGAIGLALSQHKE